MARKCAVNVDLLDVFAALGRKDLIRTLSWGDAITVLDERSTHLEVQKTCAPGLLLRRPVSSPAR